MMKKNDPKLSELLHRRGQTVGAYAQEFGIVTDDLLSRHCASHGIQKDASLEEAKTTKEAKHSSKSLSHKKPSQKNALVHLAEHVAVTPAADVSGSVGDG